MRRDDAVAILRANADELRRRGVTRLQLFGSVARDEATEQSDVDVLADFVPQIGIIKIGGIQHHLEKLLGVPVDLSSTGWLKTRVAKSALLEVVDVF